MKSLLSAIKIIVDDKTYIKDPESTEMGKKIVKNAILLIDELGLESFTFKKLAERLSSTEATIYRYFESKHKLLIYLTSWYWSWLEYKLIFATSNVSSAEERLKIAIELLCGRTENDEDFDHIDEVILEKIVISESSKVYLTKEVDKDNKLGFFLSYKRLCKRIQEIILEINPQYKFPASLVSTIAESAHNQKYFSAHLPSLTNTAKGNEASLVEFLTDMVFKTIRK